MIRMREQAEAAADKKQEALAETELQVTNLQRDIKRYKKVANQIQKTPADQKWFDTFEYDQALADITTALETKETRQKEYEVSYLYT